MFVLDSILFNVSKYILLILGLMLTQSGFFFGVLNREIEDDRKETFEVVKNILNLKVDIKKFYLYNFFLGILCIIISYLSIQYGRMVH